MISEGGKPKQNPGKDQKVGKKSVVVFEVFGNEMVNKIDKT